MPVGHLIDEKNRIDDNEANIYIGKIPGWDIVFKRKHLNFKKVHIRLYNSSSEKPFSGQGRKNLIAGNGITK